jgi:hypothetical protein
MFNVVNWEMVTKEINKPITKIGDTSLEAYYTILLIFCTIHINQNYRQILSLRNIAMPQKSQAKTMGSEKPFQE